MAAAQMNRMWVVCTDSVFTASHAQVVASPPFSLEEFGVKPGFARRRTQNTQAVLEISLLGTAVPPHGRLHNVSCQRLSATSGATVPDAEEQTQYLDVVSAVGLTHSNIDTSSTLRCGEGSDFQQDVADTSIFLTPLAEIGQISKIIISTHLVRHGARANESRKCRELRALYCYNIDTCRKLTHSGGWIY